jgi:prepilin-type N-terminal cleavage/methylation domain-containing protein
MQETNETKIARTTRAFTLIELLVVIAIIAI